MKLTEELQQLEWHYIHKRQRSPLYTYFLWEGASKHYNSNLTIPYEAKPIYFNTEIAVEAGSWQRLDKLVSEELKKNPRFLIELLHQSYLLNEENERLAKQSADVTLEEGWQKYLETTCAFGAFILLPLFIEQEMEQSLKHALEEEFGQAKVEEYFQILTTPLKASATQEEAKSLLELAVATKQGRITEDAIKHHLEGFSWIKNNSFNGLFTTKDELHQQITELLVRNPEKELAELTEHEVAHQKKVAQLRDGFVHQPTVQHLIDTLQESIYFRSWRTERYYRNAYFRKQFFARTAERLGLSSETDLFFLTPPEVIASLRGEPLNEDLIEERKYGYAIWANTKETITFSGNQLQEVEKVINLKGVQEGREIKGQCAFPGQVRGRVRVITKKEQLESVQEGEILVTTSTTPDYVPVLRRVIGIITDEGGVLSHASIIARELKLPCVIGTRVATQLLHDGDTVELNATSGVVRLDQNTV